MLKEIALKDKYDLLVDLGKNRIYLNLKGTWNRISEVPQYMDDLTECVKLLRPGFSSLSDATHFAAPTQEITDLFLEATEYMRVKGHTRSAAIIDTAYLRLYLDHHSGEMTKDELVTMYFDNAAEAEEWLDTQ